MQTPVWLRSCIGSSTLLLLLLAGTQLGTVLGRMAEFAPGPTYSISGSWLPNSLPGYCFNARSPADVALTGARFGGGYVGTGNMIKSAVAVRSTAAPTGTSLHTSQVWIISLCDGCNPNNNDGTLKMVEVTVYSTGNYTVCAYVSAARYLGGEIEGKSDFNVWPEHYDWAWTHPSSNPMTTVTSISAPGYGINSVNFVTSSGGVGGYYNGDYHYDLATNLPTSFPGRMIFDRCASAYDVSIASATMNGGSVGTEGYQAALFPSPVAATIPGAVNWIAAINDGFLKMVQVTLHMYTAAATNTTALYAYASAARFAPGSTGTRELTGEEVGNAWRSSSSSPQNVASSPSGGGYGLHKLRFTTSPYIGVSDFLTTVPGMACMTVHDTPLSTVAVRSPVMKGAMVRGKGFTHTPAMAVNSDSGTSIVATSDAGYVKMLQVALEFDWTDTACAHVSETKFIEAGQQYSHSTSDLYPDAVLSAWQHSSSKTMEVVDSSPRSPYYSLESAVITASSTYKATDWLPTTAPGFCFSAVSPADVDMADVYMSGAFIGESGYETIKAVAFRMEVNAMEATWTMAFCQACTSTVPGYVKMVQVILRRDITGGQVCAYAAAARYSAPVAHPTASLTRPYVGLYWHSDSTEHMAVVSGNDAGYGIKMATFVRHN